MACGVSSVPSWMPAGVSALQDCTEPVIEWLVALRASVEEYDPIVTVRPATPDSDTSSTADRAFADILSNLGNEIFKLDQYHRNLFPQEQQVSHSILNIFDECLEQMAEVKPIPNGVTECSDCDSTLSEVSFKTSTPKVNVNAIFDKGEGTPVPPPRVRLKTSSTTSSINDNIDLENDLEILSDSDSTSTCWSYKECSTEAVESRLYDAIWSHSSGFLNSDAILRQVLSQHHATISRLSFDTAPEFTPSDYTIYALPEVGVDRCPNETVDAMTPEKPTDDGYEPVRDAIQTDENIYEEIEFGYNYNDEGYSCGGSVEVESCSISASSEGVGRESPLYANLRDNDAYAIPADVIFWKNQLLDPYYNEDEEDEWITPEECAVYTREQRPPLVIPRITQYRTPRREPRQFVAPYIEENLPEASLKARQFDHLQNWSPTSERGRGDIERSFSKAAESPHFARINKRFGGSTENLLAAARRPSNLLLPPSSSGDSLDVEMREREVGYARSRKSRSMVAPKHRVRSPVPAPRMLLIGEEPVILEGPVRRTRFRGGGKKTKKNWTDCYMTLTATALKFYKDHKTYQACRLQKSGSSGTSGLPPSPGGARPELVLALRNAHVLHCIPAHTRRHTKSVVVTVDHDQYLIQDETEEGAKRWLQCIMNVIYSLYPGMSEEPRQPSQSSNTDQESLGRTPPTARHNRNKPKAGGSSNEDLSDSTELSIQKSQVRSRLRKFFAKRPAMDVLVKKGYYKDEPVFGRNLEEVCSSTSPRVPGFVVACVNEIESSEDNMSTDGLYRASGNLSQVQKIRLEIDQNNMSVIANNTDIHVLTGSLKLFFRELKEPLIPCSIFDRVLAACSIKPKEAKIKEFRDIVNALPQCNRDTLKYLLEHLLRVTQFSERNRMHTANLAIVFGPTLLWAPAEQAHNIAVDCIQQNNVVEILLNEFKDIFADDKWKKKA